ncbi:hypothetical protein T4B_12683 [Trichinella pseudospiralis]|uniref:Uncharacterized protein n=2 Tax=Trichinella pseudospiralis TaxID=6337 RepID=A0A0V1IKW6_TRIPS|nr:hypothetical protein T4E_2844 [Trichinella pseudospiralis]KRY92057.1 hypothetical protein T4D_4571 [Trichinella pseudospiralis]KRZ23277.1 hypothetical protein T4B_12683 [Trichinella pseudospiralis]KRZ37282.1 hypothetical protein T4C_8725 [Trichinella pseudospiralis]
MAVSAVEAARISAQCGIGGIIDKVEIHSLCPFAVLICLLRRATSGLLAKLAANKNSAIPVQPYGYNALRKSSREIDGIENIQSFKYL